MSHSTFYGTPAFITMISKSWVANLEIFQRRWCLAHSCCFVDQLAWPVAQHGYTHALQGLTSDEIDRLRAEMKQALAWKNIGSVSCPIKTFGVVAIHGCDESNNDTGVFDGNTYLSINCADGGSVSNVSIYSGPTLPIAAAA